MNGISNHLFQISYFKSFILLRKDAMATCVDIVIEMKKCFSLKDMRDFNVL